jgi:hypothetical protein
VQGDHTVLLETWRPDFAGKQSKADVVITEPTIAGAFQTYADELWERISPRNRDKNYVIWWLRQQITILENSSN